MLNVFHAFSGVDAFGMATDGLPFETVALADHPGLAPHQIAVTSHWEPGVENLGDVTAKDFMDRLDRERRGRRIDLAFGGFPCQAMSNAGQRKGLLDPRGALTMTWAEFQDLLVERGMGGEIGLGENVPGLLNDETNAFGHYLGKLAGYVRPKADRSALLADPRVAACVESLPELGDWLDANPGVVEALLDTDAFEAACTYPKSKTDGIKASIAKAKAMPKDAFKAVGKADLEAFLEACFTDAGNALDVLDVFSGFCPANHEIEPPRCRWTRDGKNWRKTWPDAGVVSGPKRTLCWRVLDPVAFGHPHRRRRVFVVGCTRESGLDPTMMTFEFDGAERGSGKPNVTVLPGRAGDVAVLVPDPKTKRFGTAFEPHWGPGPKGGPKKVVKLSDILVKGYVHPKAILTPVNRFGLLRRACKKGNPVPARLLAGLQEGVARDPAPVEAKNSELRAKAVEAVRDVEAIHALLDGLADVGPDAFAAAMAEAARMTGEAPALRKPKKRKDGEDGVFDEEDEDGEEG